MWVGFYSSRIASLTNCEWMKCNPEFVPARIRLLEFHQIGPDKLASRYRYDHGATSVSARPPINPGSYETMLQPFSYAANAPRTLSSRGPSGAEECLGRCVSRHDHGATGVSARPPINPSSYQGVLSAVQLRRKRPKKSVILRAAGPKDLAFTWDYHLPSSQKCVLDSAFALIGVTRRAVSLDKISH